MAKRILLFVVTNIAIMVTLSIIFALLGIGGYVRADRSLDYAGLMVFCLFWGMGGAFISLQLSRWMAKQAMGVHLVDGRTGQADLDWLYATVRQQTDRAALPMPEVGVYESPEVNAFATGPSKRRSLVAVSTGLLRSMRREEVEGVLAHEVSHIANGDMVTMTLIQGVVNAFVLFFARVIAHLVRSAFDRRVGDLLYFVVLIVSQIGLGLLGMLVTGWFSRQREFRADAGSATLAGRDKMIAALRRLQASKELVDTAHPALATAKIAGAKSWLSLAATHPPLEERIAALQNPR